MNMNILYEVRLPNGEVWITPIMEQAVNAAKGKAAKDNCPVEVARCNLKSEEKRRVIYHPDGKVEKLWKGGKKVI